MRSTISVVGCMLATIVTFVISGYALAGNPGHVSVQDRAPEIEAKCWFNAQPVMLFDPPRLILINFYSARSRESRELIDGIAELHEAFREKGMFVVALSADDCRDAQLIIQQKKIEYKFGAESKSAEEYGIDELPAIVLIDPKNRKIIAQWAGRQIRIDRISRTIEGELGPPRGAFIASSGPLSEADVQRLSDATATARQQIESIVKEIFAGNGPIEPEALAPLDRFYEEKLHQDTLGEGVMDRAYRLARISSLGPDRETGYSRLWDDGRLTDAARNTIRNRMLYIAENDPSPGVRINALAALRRSPNLVGNTQVLDRLRGLRTRESEPMTRAAIDHAIRELDPATREESMSQLHSLKLRRMLNQSPDPTSTPWVDAYAYSQSTSQRTNEQLLEDYTKFADPPDDEIGRQNALLKRSMALNELGNRIARGEVRDLQEAKEGLVRGFSQEPDAFIRCNIVAQLNSIAERGGRELRTEVMEFFEKSLTTETDNYARGFLESFFSELKSK